ncbi:MAG: hypothetical protein L6R38_003208 [Xanthoria sp. 2 TBL-2021]|nr:MAG: hypothetical protein L6R38_003208 [Xanthoria sp. 2 TBL-2021]
MTAQLTCCACGDKRPQAPSFNRYIDGVGFVLGGKRQERYCPNCQHFWDARIEVSGIPQSSTRIPTVPDQTTFTQQWFDWHRGYSIITNPDGTEDRQVLIGESLSQVEIGHLPRTTEEIQAGVEASLNAQSSNPEQNVHDETRPRLSSEDIDPEERIFDSSSTSESAFDSDPEGSQDNTTAAQHLLRELRQNLEDLRANVIELTQTIPRRRASSQVSTISSQLNSITRSIGTIRQQHNSNTQQLAAARAMDRSDLRIPSREEHSDDELLQRVGQMFNQRRQLLNSPESPLRNSQLALLAVDIDRVLIVCDSRGRPDPVFGSRPFPSLLERAIALRNSIMGSQTHATQHAQSYIASPAGPSQSEQYLGGAQAQGILFATPDVCRKANGIVVRVPALAILETCLMATPLQLSQPGSGQTVLDLPLVFRPEIYSMSPRRRASLLDQALSFRLTTIVGNIGKHMLRNGEMHTEHNNAKIPHFASLSRSHLSSENRETMFSREYTGGTRSFMGLLVLLHH